LLARSGAGKPKGPAPAGAREKNITLAPVCSRARARANRRDPRQRAREKKITGATPVFMTTALVLTMMGVSATVAAALFYSYAALRIAHSVCYVRGIQPLRTISFVLALIIQVVVLRIIGYGAFAG
jgi:uncharacterized MAPEG superfamily protein